MFGEVAERFKALVLKTSDTAMYRGFESHPLRHTDRFAARNFIPCSFLYLGIKNKPLLFAVAYSLCSIQFSSFSWARQ